MNIPEESIAKLKAIVDDEVGSYAAADFIQCLFDDTIVNSIEYLREHNLSIDACRGDWSGGVDVPCLGSVGAGLMQLGDLGTMYESAIKFNSNFRTVFQNDAVREFLVYGLASDHSGYWYHPRFIAHELFSPSLFLALGNLSSQISLEWLTGVDEFPELLSSLERAKSLAELADTVARLREIVHGVCVPYQLEQRHGGDDIPYRLRGELFQLKSYASGLAMRFNQPPQTWLTAKRQVTDTADMHVDIQFLRRVHRSVQKKGHVDADTIVGKNQQGILCLRILEHLGLYQGHKRRVRADMATKVTDVVRALDLTAESFVENVV